MKEDAPELFAKIQRDCDAWGKLYGKAVAPGVTVETVVSAEQFQIVAPVSTVQRCLRLSARSHGRL